MLKVSDGRNRRKDLKDGELVELFNRLGKDTVVGWIKDTEAYVDIPAGTPGIFIGRVKSNILFDKVIISGNVYLFPCGCVQRIE